MNIIYFDNNATTKALPEVIEKMLPYFGEKYGNASSIHGFGGANKKVIDAARAQAAELINAAPPEIIFTCGGTESDSTAIYSAVRSFPSKKRIITSAVEHPAVLEVFKLLSSMGYKADFIGVDGNGRFNMEEFKSKISQDVAVVSVMLANSETGTIFPVKEIAEIAHKYGVLVHCDAVQAVGKIKVDAKDLNVDMLSVSAHKIHGPKGIGALYVKSGTRLLPFMVGGHQENGRRAGTENVPAIVGFGAAAQYAANTLGEYKKTSQIRDYLESEITKLIADTKINGDINDRLPNTTNISFGYIEGESILTLLDEHGICASSGSACTTGLLEPSHVLKAMGVPFIFAHGSLRFSLSKFSTKEEADETLRALPPIVAKLREISPFKPKGV
jgi:cysteine desulfurase